MKKFFAALLASSVLCMSTVSAEVETYEGTDEYIMSEFETLDVAKQRAKQKAERAAQEKAGVYIESRTEISKMMVTKDEIITMTGGILKVVDAQYKLTPLEDGKSMIVRATVKANIDSDDISKWLNRSTAERSDLVAQNLELQKALDAQDKQIAELKRQIADKPQDAARFSEQFAAEDKNFRSNRQLAEVGKFYYNGDYNGAINLCTRAIELNPANATAYSIRGTIYYRLNDYNGAIADFNRAIQLNPNDYKNFYNRGLAYVKLNNFSQAAQNFETALQLNPNDSDSRQNLEACRQRLSYGLR